MSYPDPHANDYNGIRILKTHNKNPSLGLKGHTKDIAVNSKCSHQTHMVVHDELVANLT